MKHNRYKELNSKGEELRQVSITDEQAEKFNKGSKESGISYELVKVKTKTKK